MGLAVNAVTDCPQLAGRPSTKRRLGFDLADTFAGDRELLADFLERMVGVHADAEAHQPSDFLRIKAY